MHAIWKSNPRSRSLLMCALLLGVGTARAQDYGNFAEQYSKLISKASDISVLDERLFGDQVSLYSGGLSFAQTDLSLPGPGFPMAVTRSFKAEDRGGNGTWALGAFGDWDLDLPRLHGTFAKAATNASGWTMRHSPLRCGGSTDPYEAMPPLAAGQNNNGVFDAYEYWAGNHFSLPGGGDQEMMLVSANNPNKPTDGLDYRWVTNNQWFFSCLPATANGFAGDAFLARGPDGSKIWFNHLAKQAAPDLRKNVGVPNEQTLTGGGSAKTSGSTALTDGGGSTPNIWVDNGVRLLVREENELLPTRIEDRFGNSLDFSYDSAVPGRLLTITASDGRTITFTYNTTGQIASVSDGTRTWWYGYTAAPLGTVGQTLTQVTLPDQSTWQINLGAVARFQPMASAGGPSDSCNNLPAGSNGSVVGTITHPSGAVGTFTLAAVKHARSYVVKTCVQDSGTPPYVYHALNPNQYYSPTLTSKQISGPGLATATWTYSYSAAAGSWASDCPNNSCPSTTTVQVRAPDNRWQRYTFGTRFRTDEGRLYRQESGEVTTVNGVETLVTLRDEQSTFQDATGQPFPAEVGQIVHARGDGMAARLDPQKTHVITQQGATFSSTTTAFDTFAAPMSVTRASSGGAGGNFSKTETTIYEHNTAKWVIGSVKSVSDGETGKVVRQTDFDTATMLPWKVYAFGLLQQTLAFNADGTLASVSDGAGNTTRVDNWYRGVPRLITYPTFQADGTTRVHESAVVSPIGTVTSTTDELGTTTSYGYDPMGRLSLIDYTDLDPVLWNSTVRSFGPISSAEYGLPAGHWKQTVQTGNGKASTLYDAQWRPVLVITEDTGSAASRTFVVTRYDNSGRVVFKSYPVASLVSITDPLSGTTTRYDALGRVTQTQQDSELGPLLTRFDFLPGFVSRVTNPRAIITETRYQTFDEPSTDSPVMIVSAKDRAEQQTTTIARDDYGKPLTLTRSGSDGGAP